MSNGNDRNWVTEKADIATRRNACTGENVLRQLKERVLFDVDEINKIDCSVNYEIVDGDKEFSVVATGPDAEKRGVVKFKQNTHKIYVDNGAGYTFFVQWKWNESYSTCELCINGDSMPIWEITQMALVRQFFPDDAIPIR